MTTPVRFGEHFQLLATQIEAVQSGARLTLWWQTDQPTSVDYTVFAHLLDDSQLLLEQADGPPDAGRSPTTIWRQGDVIRDVRDFATPLPAGGEILVGFYALETLARLPAMRGDTLLADSAAHIAIR